MKDKFRFELKSLDVFVTTVDCGNMTLAAERLGMTQSAVSQQLTNLEQALEMNLLDRSVRPLLFTTAGRFFYDNAQKILLLAQKTDSNMRQTKFDQLDHVNISIVDSLVSLIGPYIIEELNANVSSWSIDCGLSHLHSNKLLSRNVDLILSDDAMENHKDLKRQMVLREPFVLVLPKSHCTDGNHLEAAAKTLPFIRYNETTLISRKVESYLTRISLTPVHRIKADNTAAIFNLVTAGVGWTITTPLCLYQVSHLLRLVECLPLHDESLYRELFVVHRDYRDWTLPNKIFKKCRDVLAGNFCQFVNQHLAWSSGKVILNQK